MRLYFVACAPVASLGSCASCGGAIVSSSEVATIVSGVDGAGFAASVAGGVVPVCGRATVVMAIWLLTLAPRGDEVLVVVELSLLWFGVGGLSP